MVHHEQSTLYPAIRSLPFFCVQIDRAEFTLLTYCVFNGSRFSYQ